MKQNFMISLLMLSSLVAVAVVASAAQSPGQSQVIPAPIGHGYLGTWANPALGNQASAMGSLETVLGRTLSIHTSYWGLNAGNHLSSIASNPAIQDDISHSRLPLISWGCNGATGNTFQDIANGTYDQSEVIPAAQAIKSLSTKVFIRPSWEFNLNADNPPGNPNGNNCYSSANVGNLQAQQAEYIAYFQHLVKVFADQGVKNVSWVWCPVASAAEFQKHSLIGFYPGSDYVDWIAGDTYDKPAQPVRGFVGIWTPFWNHFSSLGKPLMIAETGEYNNASDGFTQQKFFEDAASALSPGGAFNKDEKTRIAAFVYFDSKPKSNNNWSLETPTDTGGETAFSAMAKLNYFQRIF